MKYSKRRFESCHLIFQLGCANHQTVAGNGRKCSTSTKIEGLRLSVSQKSEVCLNFESSVFAVIGQNTLYSRVI
uniref:Uncharacterized protein n=1 Tax=Nelumbo nucifera TaxID=4432 RepID=A0A822XQY2_NELNU|nr:TPA_asm: hypothetical protein HUJ06_022829 [Nelumbo nucifera]